MSHRFTKINFENASLTDIHDLMKSVVGETRLRCMAIIMVGTGSSREQVIYACGIDERTIRKWIALFNKKGTDGLIVR